MRQLEQFLASNVKDLEYEEVGFDRKAMRQHVLTHLTERRRKIAKGHDYTMV